jgi:sulfur-carrier protein adenylyltransferase/sulfurtransferase
VMLGKPHVWGSIYRFDGQVSVWWAEHGPCYRCVFPEPPPPGMVPSCAEGGVLGVLCAAIGSVQTTETLKLLTGVGEPLVGRLMVHDALRQSWDTLTVRKDPDCAVCGTAPTVTALVDYEVFCGVVQAEGAAAAVPTLTAAELAAVLGGAAVPSDDAAVTVVDVRGPDERAIAAIPGAVAVHLDQLRSGGGVAQVPFDRAVVVLCKSGARSAEAARILLDAGHPDVRSLEGGVLAWVRDVDPSQPVY